MFPKKNHCFYLIIDVLVHQRRQCTLDLLNAFFPVSLCSRSFCLLFVSLIHRKPAFLSPSPCVSVAISYDSTTLRSVGGDVYILKDKVDINESSSSFNRPDVRIQCRARPPSTASILSYRSTCLHDIYNLVSKTYLWVLQRVDPRTSAFSIIRFAGSGWLNRLCDFSSHYKGAKSLQFVHTGLTELTRRMSFVTQSSNVALSDG